MLKDLTISLKGTDKDNKEKNKETETMAIML